MEDDAMPPVCEIFLHGWAVMTAGIITDDVDVVVARQAAP
jgi:hypothetical protein